LRYEKVAGISEIPLGKMKMVKAGGKDILIVNLDGKYFAMEDKCTHAGGDLSRGSLSGNVVICPRHGAKFDITTGKLVAGPKFDPSRKIENEHPFEIRIEGNDIQIKVSD